MREKILYHFSFPSQFTVWFIPTLNVRSCNLGALLPLHYRLEVISTISHSFTLWFPPALMGGLVRKGSHRLWFSLAWGVTIVTLPVIRKSSHAETRLTDIDLRSIARFRANKQFSCWTAQKKKRYILLFWTSTFKLQLQAFRLNSTSCDGATASAWTRNSRYRLRFFTIASNLHPTPLSVT